MIINKHGTDGVKVLKPEIFKDKRGYFYEAFNENKLSKLLKKKISIKQSNISFSKKNVFRGFHFQEKNHAQEKFVRVLSVKILDIIIGSIYGIILFSNLFYFSYIAFFKNFIDDKNRIMKFNISIYENLMYKDSGVKEEIKKDTSNKDNDKDELY